MDAKDILGVRGGGAAAPAARKSKEVAPAKPKGVSREVWQITQGYSTDALPAPPLVPTAGFKEKRKPSSKRLVRWDWKPFTSSAREDGLALMHWVKRMEGGAPMLKPGSNGGDLNGDYAFAKYNKKIELYEYNDAEWDALGLGDAPGWTRAETDYLLGLCAQYDLRFHVIADRYHYQQPEADAAAQQPACVVRSVDELKGRYYSIAHALIQSRTDTPDQIAHKELIRHPYQAAAESERRELLTGLLCRTSGADAEEEALLASACAVEARRRQEVEQARASGQPLPAYCRPAGKFPELSMVRLEDLDTEKDPGGPSLPTPRGGSARPPRGVYVRGVHTIAMATELVTHSFASSGGRPRDKKGLDNFNKKVDLALEELGVRPPHTATRGVCRAWYALRREVAQLLELRAQLARRSREAGGVGAVGAPGAPAATPYGGHQMGGVDGLGSPHKSPPWARAETPGSGAPLSAEEEEGRQGGPQQAKRDHKRKPNPRYEGADATSPKEAQAAAKKKKRSGQ